MRDPVWRYFSRDSSSRLCVLRRRRSERGSDRRRSSPLYSLSLIHILHYNRKDPAWEKLMITYHACHERETGECSTMSYWTDEEAWIRFIMLQSGHGLEPKNYELVKKEYDRQQVMPVWDGEPAYEMMPTSWPPVNASFHGSWTVSYTHLDVYKRQP